MVMQGFMSKTHLLEVYSSITHLMLLFKPLMVMSLQMFTDLDMKLAHG